MRCTFLIDGARCVWPANHDGEHSTAAESELAEEQAKEAGRAAGEAIAGQVSELAMLRSAAVGFAEAVVTVRRELLGRDEIVYVELDDGDPIDGGLLVVSAMRGDRAKRFRRQLRAELRRHRQRRSSKRRRRRR